MNGFNFSFLNREQSALLDAAGWTAGCARPAPTRRAVRELVERGLIEAYPAMHEDDHGPYKVVEYYVPQEVQRAWQALNSSRGQEIDSGDLEERQL
ncbi:hypothetical protein AB9H29_18140 [Stenotrophomonas sepilia]|uniref:hypothetical protein n=1 Tax=Stenotrophomonas sepilia TaxID=2860290 RepID=UPI0035569C47